jgi:aryl-alcohol dehydrogenase-like predicted oxidoreductase
MPDTRPVPVREFGRTGELVSALALGGYHLADAGSYRDAERIVRACLDAGVTFMDNAWEYHEGKSEEWMGRALEGRRQEAFLMTKACSHGRDGKTALRQLEESLRRLRTDHLDLWQIHEVIHDDDPERHYRAGGAVEALERAKRDGKTRYVGFTGHKDPDIHLRMLTGGFPFDAVQLPLNCFDASFRSFEARVLPELVRRGIAPIGMKSLGDGAGVKARKVKARDALRYAMSLPVATTVSGIDSMRILRQNLGVARGFAPMPEAERRALVLRVAEFAVDGRFELYKTSKKHDGPIGRQVHGFPPPEELAG